MIQIPKSHLKKYFNTNSVSQRMSQNFNLWLDSPVFHRSFDLFIKLLRLQIQTIDITIFWLKNLHSFLTWNTFSVIFMTILRIFCALNSDLFLRLKVFFCIPRTIRWDIDPEDERTRASTWLGSKNAMD